MWNISIINIKREHLREHPNKVQSERPTIENAVRRHWWTKHHTTPRTALGFSDPVQWTEPTHESKREHLREHLNVTCDRGTFQFWFHPTDWFPEELWHSNTISKVKQFVFNWVWAEYEITNNIEITGGEQVRLGRAD
jgi:hypothetical protein